MKAASFSRPQTARWRLLLWLSLGALLSAPLIAMQFTSEVSWTAFDFAVMAVLLAVAGLAVELLLSRMWTPWMRLLGCLGILAGVVLVWIEGAVGIFH
ncbi:MAG: hypothetical protein WC563_05945 [Brevundimonas sp.]